jgi:hypothetical protein
MMLPKIPYPWSVAAGESERDAAAQRRVMEIDLRC